MKGRVQIPLLSISAGKLVQRRVSIGSKIFTAIHRKRGEKNMPRLVSQVFDEEDLRGTAR